MDSKTANEIRGEHIRGVEHPTNLLLEAYAQILKYGCGSYGSEARVIVLTEAAGVICRKLVEG